MANAIPCCPDATVEPTVVKVTGTESGSQPKISRAAKIAAHGAAMAQYNKQASEFIFRENNAEGRVPSDTIDLHGQFAEEAEDVRCEQRCLCAGKRPQLNRPLRQSRPLLQQL